MAGGVALSLMLDTIDAYAAFMVEAQCEFPRDNRNKAFEHNFVTVFAPRKCFSQGDCFNAWQVGMAATKKG
jgi:hypothetical protein